MKREHNRHITFHDIVKLSRSETTEYPSQWSRWFQRLVILLLVDRRSSEDFAVGVRLALDEELHAAHRLERRQRLDHRADGGAEVGRAGERLGEVDLDDALDQPDAA